MRKPMVIAGIFLIAGLTATCKRDQKEPLAPEIEMEENRRVFGGETEEGLPPQEKEKDFMDGDPGKSR